MKLSTILDDDNDVPNMKSSGLIVNSSGGCAVLWGQCIEEIHKRAYGSRLGSIGMLEKGGNSPSKTPALPNR